MSAHKALRKAHREVPKPTGAWGIYRDGELYSVERARWIANGHRDLLIINSKHHWKVIRVFVTPATG